MILRTLCVILISLISTFSLFGQKQTSSIKNTEKMIVGSWRVDTIYMKQGVDLGQYYDLYVAKFKEIKEHTLFEFYKNKTYKKSGLKGIEITGTWRLSPEGKRIIVNMDNTGVDEMSKIVSISNDTLIIAPLEESSNSKVVLYKFMTDE